MRRMRKRGPLAALISRNRVLRSLGEQCVRAVTDAELRWELRAHPRSGCRGRATARPFRRGCARPHSSPARSLCPRPWRRSRDQRGLPWLADLAARRALRAPHPSTDADVCRGRAGDARDRHRRRHRSLQPSSTASLLKPLAYPNPEELVAVWHTAPGAPGLSQRLGDLRLSASMYFTYAENNRTFRDFGLWFTGSATVTGATEPEEVRHSPRHRRHPASVRRPAGAGPLALAAPTRSRARPEP